MSDINNSIKYLYGKFIFRDLLSFVTPGAIIIVSLILFNYDLSQEKLFIFFKSIPFIENIIIYCICYIFGCAIQCFGILIGVLKFYNPKYVINSTKHNNTKDKGGMKKFCGIVVHWERVADFFYKTKGDDEIRDIREHLIALKQMCGNSSLAIFIAGIIYSIKLWQLSEPFILILYVMIGTLIISSLLLWGHYSHVDQQVAWENIFINGKIVKGKGET